MNWLRNTALAVVALSCGCDEFPCLDSSTSHSLESVAFSHEDRVRYTYWFEDGAQRVVFDRSEIPETARHAVLVHVAGKTDGDLHGATGWNADVSSDGNAATAYFRPMAQPRTRSYAAWAGEWTSTWVRTRAGTFATELAANQAMHDALDGNAAPAAGPVPALQKELTDEGLSLNGLKLGRALRVVGARQPLPRDFGLSVAVHPTWLFATTECDACDQAIAWLDERGDGYHVLLVTDPTNAKTLRDLSRRAGVETPAIPTMWRHDQLLRGFEPQAWETTLDER